MDCLALCLEASERDAYLEVQSWPMHAPTQYVTGERPNERHTRTPRYKITWAEILLECGIGQERVMKILRMSENTVRDVLNGRFDEDGVLPYELEAGEKYVNPPRRCECGHVCRVWPCRTCRLERLK